MENQNQNSTVEVKNEGQKVIYLLRKAFLEGSLSSSNNPNPEIQFILNKPVSIDSKLYQPDAQDIQFLEDVMKKVSNQEIHLFTPATLLNNQVYDRASSSIKAKADYDILILLHKIRQIKQLWDSGDHQSYQIMNLVHSLRLIKENLESAEGDIFII